MTIPGLKPSGGGHVKCLLPVSIKRLPERFGSVSSDSRKMS